MSDSSSQGNAGDKEKSKEGEANEENNEESKTVKGTSIKIFSIFIEVLKPYYSKIVHVLLKQISKFPQHKETRCITAPPLDGMQVCSRLTYLLHVM